ncbi:hypothetical protein [Psychrobacillus psychrodurans]|uniref:hypothetical protein n=1 Tax=Psychrobacillus psychrodurans TaxID=126157 RepID=UPI0008EA6C92|nr:hypothetical protein [Psychrobacillus psychrodurans]MCZ8541892.1 hypothetical protein [Psychrobacillus psychrodurans]SFN10921.1 hypothetical protein SAMN05421832_11517 [Psychrobacillus psychrodurans]
MLWKIYFWIMLVLLIVSMFLENEYGRGETVLRIVSTIIAIINTLGFYGYVYKKQLYSLSFWKIIFIVTVIDVVVSILYYGFQDAELGTEGIIFLAVFTFIIMFPLLLGLYRYGFQNQKIAEKVL